MTTTAAPIARRLYRRRQGRLVAGVAAGLADHLGIDVMAIRIGFVVTVALGGLGIFLYAAAWAVVPQRTDEPREEVAHSSRQQLVTFAVLGVVMLVLAQLVGFGPGFLWPAAAVITGSAIVWRQADESQRLRWRSLASRGARLEPGGSRLRTALWYGSGALLVVIGMATFLAMHVALPQARRATLPVLVVVIGLFLLLGPWVLRALREASEERTARIREHERVELAGRVHDSMLQTLTLIDQRATEPDEVRRLVRRSERELRGWLYSPPPQPETLQATIHDVCADIEDHYAVTIHLVMVGDHPVSEAVQALAQAVREATLNAAKHSGVAQIAVYLEVYAGEIVVYIRDRGRGFDPTAVPADRFGVRDSVVARMHRHGGDAVIRSSAAGTEIRLSLPLQESVRA